MRAPSLIIGKEKPLDDRVLAEGTADDPKALSRLGDDRRDFWIGERRARAFRVAIEALAGLLSEPAKLAERVGDGGAKALCLSHAPADVETGEIARRERSHGEAEIDHRGVDLLRERAFKQHTLGGGVPLPQHAVADEAMRIADDDRDLAEAAGKRDERGERFCRRAPLPRTISTRRITLAGLKKCMPATEPGRLVASAMRSMSR